MQIEIDTALGPTVIEVDDGFAAMPQVNQAALIDRARSEIEMQYKPAPAETQRLRAVGQGVSMGFGDEIEAFARNPLDAIGGTIGLTDGAEYGATLGDIRGKLDAYRDDRPLEAIGYEMGGAVLPAIGAGLLSMGTGGAAVGASTAARLAPTVGRLAKVGAAEGFVSGFGSGEGGITDRLGSGAVGAAFGGALGAAAPTAANLGGRAVRSVGDSLGIGGAKRAQTFSERKMLEALQRDGMTPEEALTRLQEAQAMGVPDIVPADLGENLRGSAWRSQAVPNPNRQAVVDQFAERQTSQAGQIADAATDLAGSPRTGFDFIDDLDAKVRAEAKPAYDLAYQQMLDPKPFQPFMGRKVIVDAYRRAQDLADIRGDGNMPPLDRLLSGNAMPTEAAHQIKQGLDALIEAETDALGKVSSRGRELVKLKGQWNDAIVAQNDNYRVANATFADRARLRDGFTMGSKFNAIPEKELVRKVGKMTPAEREALKSGVITKVQELASSTTDATNFVKTVFGSPQRRMALRLAFGDPKEFEKFEKFIRVQTDKVRTTNKVMGNSSTVERQIAMQDGGIDPSALVDLGANAATGNVMGMARSLAQQGAARLTGMNEKSAETMSRMLFEADPARQQEMLNALLRRQIMDRDAKRSVLARPETYSGFIGNMSGLLAGQ